MQPGSSSPSAEMWRKSRDWSFTRNTRLARHSDSSRVATHQPLLLSFLLSVISTISRDCNASQTSTNPQAICDGQRCEQYAWRERRVYTKHLYATPAGPFTAARHFRGRNHRALHLFSGANTCTFYTYTISHTQCSTASRCQNRPSVRLLHRREETVGPSLSHHLLWLKTLQRHSEVRAAPSADTDCVSGARSRAIRPTMRRNRVPAGKDTLLLLE